MKIVVPGGSGFLGSTLIPRLRQQGHDVILVSRSRRETEPPQGDTGSLTTTSWDDNDEFQAAIDNAGAVINLAGRSVDCRYNAKNREEIFSSRIDTTHAIGDAIARSAAPPPVWLNASTATIFREAFDRVQTDSDGEIGEGFSVGIGKEWEAEFFKPELPNTRRVAMRITIALGHGGGLLPPSLMLARLGLGGKQGSGRQMVSWIHLEDLCRAVEFLLEQDQVSGPIILGSPDPITNADLMRAIRKEIKMPIGLPAAEWMVKIGALALRTESELVLKSRWVYPERLLAAGFEFKFPKLEQALADLL